MLIDRFSRQVDYLRLSVTDRCDFRCTYCMAEDMTFVPRKDVLTLEQIHRLARIFIESGVKRIRLTGGEPLVRPGIVKLAGWIAATPGLQELNLTTNGSRLAEFAHPLKEAGVTRLNISLDSLVPDRFRALTRVGELSSVLAGIDAAQQAGFRRIRLNSVIMRESNDDEVVSLAEFALSRGLDIAFIEEMPMGDMGRGGVFVSSEDVLEQLRERWTLTPVESKGAGPSRDWQVPGYSGRIGFISPHSHNFCHLCNRVRLTVTGRLLLCLGHEHSADLKQVLTDHPVDDMPVREAIVAAMDLKPERHYFPVDANGAQPVRFMNMTGG